MPLMHVKQVTAPKGWTIVVNSCTPHPGAPDPRHGLLWWIPVLLMLAPLQDVSPCMPCVLHLGALAHITCCSSIARNQVDKFHQFETVLQNQDTGCTLVHCTGSLYNVQVYTWTFDHCPPNLPVLLAEQLYNPAESACEYILLCVLCSSSPLWGPSENARWTSAGIPQRMLRWTPVAQMDASGVLCSFFPLWGPSENA